MTFNLHQYLQENKVITKGGEVKISSLAGGNINHISLVQTQDQSFIVKRALPTTKFNPKVKITPERIETEHKAMKIFAERTNLLHIPKVKYFDPKEHLLIMQAVPQQYYLLTYDLLEGKVDFSLVKKLAKFYAQIHNATYNDKYLQKETFSDKMYKEVKLGLFHGRFLVAAKNQKIKDNMHRIIEKSLHNRICLIHGDAQPKNILVYKDQFYVLDYEIARYGDPAHDIGNLMAHYLLAGIINFPQRQKYYKAMQLFFNEYAFQIKFKKIIQKIKINTLAHIAPILYCRIDGTFKIEVLDERTKQCIRAISRNLGEIQAQNFSDIFPIVDKEGTALHTNQPIMRENILGKKIF